jgi:hypothetical protein
MEILERVLSIVKANGPLLPADIAREINTNLIVAGAMLSELVGKGQIKISTVKVGGSPLYYAAGQEFKLQQYANRLGSKEKEAYELLKAKGVLRDRALEPVIRVALRQIKDFAKPLDVTIQGDTEIFWKWYLLSSEDASDAIRQELTPKEEPKPLAVEKPVEMPAQKAKEEPKVEKKEPEKKEEAPKKEEKKEEVKPAPEAKKPKKKEEKAEVRVEAPPAFEDKTVGDAFLAKLLAHFKKNSIEVIEKNIIKKNSEMEFILKIPSPVGSLKYYCKAKAKAKVNDGDISSAYVQGHMKKLPVLFIYTGELTKKAKGMLSKEFDNVTIKKL